MVVNPSVFARVTVYLGKVKKVQNTEIEQKLSDISGVWDLRTRARFKHNIYQVSDIIIFAKYQRNRRDQNDIALVKVDRKIQFSKTVMPICLPPKVSR